MVDGARASPPSFSVVVPCLDEVARVDRTLRRLRRLLPDSELVVADGGSSDGTEALAGRHARVVASPRGRGPQMNAGAAASTGDVLLFLHVDCSLRHDPRPQLAALLHDPACAAVYFTQRLRARGLAYRCIERAATARARLCRWLLGDLGLAMRRDTFVACGGFPDQPLFEDHGISRRLRPLGRFTRCDLHLWTSARRWSSNGVMRTTLINWGLTGAYLLGVSPQRLARWYRRRPPDVGAGALARYPVPATDPGAAVGRESEPT